jgi:hypothetical protein
MIDPLLWPSFPFLLAIVGAMELASAMELARLHWNAILKVWKQFILKFFLIILYKLHVLRT